jgi:predicted protein tyrosine phosphatase
MVVHVSLREEPCLHEVAPRLRYGNLEAAHRAANNDMAVVHACKEPCHRQVIGGGAAVASGHPEYLAATRGLHLYLNMIDPPVPLFKLEMFAAFFAFIDQHYAARTVLIHCNQGLSRAPSLALLVMAKRLGLLPNENYAAARGVFEQQYPYAPGAGIATFLAQHWDSLGR